MDSSRITHVKDTRAADPTRKVPATHARIAANMRSFGRWAAPHAVSASREVLHLIWRAIVLLIRTLSAFLKRCDVLAARYIVNVVARRAAIAGVVLALLTVVMIIGHFSKPLAIKDNGSTGSQPQSVAMKRWRLGPGMFVELPAEWEVSQTGAENRWVEVQYGGSKLAFRAASAIVQPEPQAAIPASVEFQWNLAENKREVSTSRFTYTIGEVSHIKESWLRGKLAVRDVSKVHFARVWFWGRGNQLELDRIVEAVNAGLRSDGVLAAREASEDELFATHIGKRFSVKLPREGLVNVKREGSALVLSFEDPEGGGSACLGFAVFEGMDSVSLGKIDFNIGRVTVDYFRQHPDRVHAEWVKRPQAAYRLAWPVDVAPGTQDPVTVYGTIGPRPENVTDDYLWFWGSGDQVALNRLLLNVRQGYRLIP